MSEAIDLQDEAARLDEFWSQRVLAEANGSLFKVAKGIGEVSWHQHDDQDETFLVLSGELVVRLRDPEERAVPLSPGQLFVVPQGVQHAPVSAAGASFLVIGRTVTSTAEGGKPAWSEGGGAAPEQV
ncbi:cupin domain-containing protein [Homoserinibacter sp. YIM 151385]|uniref:cupin domain-containing protein n=1 Tax=Homoserinibacter sp. YIM 151385 TaxID=2985506 RepID=UPI0022F0F804|nr:cupin domain-containing protein [Homoserinibacter sp. YIM 151385]WBU37087.1 cupin domain-containing protein [Homoserinibacter sp. YIM 151385]